MGGYFAVEERLSLCLPNLASMIWHLLALLVAVAMGCAVLFLAAVAMSFWGSGIEWNALLFACPLAIGAVCLVKVATRWETPVPPGFDDPYAEAPAAEVAPAGEWSSEPNIRHRMDSGVRGRG